MRSLGRTSTCRLTSHEDIDGQDVATNLITALDAIAVARPPRPNPSSWGPPTSSSARHGQDRDRGQQ
eukprot:1051847-Pyramimonas_sp.AAC.1